MTADVGVGGGVAEGLVGGWSPAVGLGGTLAYRRLSARLGALWLPAKANDYGPGRVEVGLAVARLALCVTGAPRSIAGGGWGCALQQQVGWMRGRGFDYDASNRVADHLWLATGVAIVVERSAGTRARLGGRGGGGAPPPAATVRGRQPRHRVPVGAGGVHDDAVVHHEGLVMRRRPSLRRSSPSSLAAGAAPACAPDTSSVGARVRRRAGADGRVFRRPVLPAAVGRLPRREHRLRGLGAERPHPVARARRPATSASAGPGRSGSSGRRPPRSSFELEGRVRLWIDDSPIIDDWVDSGIHREARGTVPVRGGGLAGSAGRVGSAGRSDDRQAPRRVGLRARSDRPRPRAAPPDHRGRRARSPTCRCHRSRAQALSPHGLIVGGVSSEADLFWDAWVVPLDGGAAAAARADWRHAGLGRRVGRAVDDDHQRGRSRPCRLRGSAVAVGRHAVRPAVAGPPRHIQRRPRRRGRRRGTPARRLRAPRRRRPRVGVRRRRARQGPTAGPRSAPRLPSRSSTPRSRPTRCRSRSSTPRTIP